RPDVGLARAGWAISAYAVGVVIGAPLLSLLAVRLSRARLIVVFATLLAVSTLASGIMPSFELTIAARFLAGLPHGAYLGGAALLRDRCGVRADRCPGGRLDPCPAQPAGSGPG